jgi:hypothetical protein
MWLSALAVGIMTASFGTILGFIGGDVVARAHGATATDQGVWLFLGFVAAGLVLGLTLGIGFTRSSGVRDMSGMVKQFTRATLATTALMGIATGIGYLLG